MMMGPLNLIIGFGYMGRHLAELLAGKPVCVTTRSESKQTLLQQEGLDAFCFNANNPFSDGFLDYLHKQNSITAFCLLPPSQLDTSQFSVFLTTLKQLPIHRAILTSSTVVYGTKERTVDADSEAIPDSNRAQRQYQVEQSWLETGTEFYVLRLSGLYGKNRIIGEKQLSQNLPLASDPDNWLNLIHAEDAARLIWTIADSKTAGRIELGCDGTPVKRHDYYTWLADKLQTNPPVFLPPFQGANRRCCNLITQKRTGWQPSYIDYKKGITAVLKPRM